MTVLYERQGATAVITMASPATRNAFTPEIREGLASAVARVRADPDVRAVILTGSGGCFCAGGDIRGMRESHAAPPAPQDGELRRTRLHGIQQWVGELASLDRPVIAAVDGPAFGAGFSLALAADFVLATPRARFCMVFMRIGLVPDCGAAHLLPRVVGMQRAKELMLSAREVAADEALRLGIAMELHTPEALLPRALALAASFAQASPLAVSLVKRQLHDAGGLATAFEAEANAQALALASAPHREAVERFLGKQPLAFQWPGQAATKD
ncbi:MAG: enoyl-CoA hydratase/isomerase family protein [Rubrivivax sp.]|nr:enoyl-CoA hydratase/isomerase family protein [Rubrivivax sp.]MCL4699529.1 enoyl-CoA hydratase/isomerase family protein [Burkholderiaceae bacterium]